MTPLTIGGPNFWVDVRRAVVAGKGVAHLNDGGLQYAALTTHAEMRVVRRTAEELFSATVNRAVTRDGLEVVINGSFYDVTVEGMADAAFGKDPVPATASTPVGAVIDGGVAVTGTRASPEGFHLGFKRDSTKDAHAAYRFGSGDPTRVAEGIGGLGPVIINALKFGNGNKYRAGVPAGAKEAGAPEPEHAPFLTQRNNNQYVAFAARGAMVGKVLVAVSRAEQMILLLVLRNISLPGIELDALRDKLVAVKIDDAVFLDGSDSVMLNIGGTFHIPMGEDKNECCTIGLGFRYRQKAYLFRGGQHLRYDVEDDKGEAGYPQAITATVFRKLPGAWTSGIDAAVEWKDGLIYLFKGKEWLALDRVKHEVDRGPSDLAGFPGMPPAFAAGIDAAANLGKGKVYFFKGDQYVRYDLATDAVDLGPFKIDHVTGGIPDWEGMPPTFAKGIDAAITWTDGNVYFFKGPNFVRFNVTTNKVDQAAQPISAKWKDLGSFAAGVDAAVLWGDLVV